MKLVSMMILTGLTFAASNAFSMDLSRIDSVVCARQGAVETFDPRLDDHFSSTVNGAPSSYEFFRVSNVENIFRNSPTGRGLLYDAELDQGVLAFESANGKVEKVVELDGDLFMIRNNVIIGQTASVRSKVLYKCVINL